MVTNTKIVRYFLADNRYTVFNENVTINGTQYKMLLQREITNESNNMAEALCVNCFQFYTNDESDVYMLNLGYDADSGNYSFGFIINGIYQYIDMDNIYGSRDDLPEIKECFKEYFDSSFGFLSKEVKYEDIQEILNAMFDYCYDYLVEHGFHIVDIKNG